MSASIVTTTPPEADEVTADTVLPVTDPETRRSSRRVLLLGAVGAVGAVAAQALASPLPAAAASVQLGGTNTETNRTQFNNTKASSSAKAVVGQTTYTGSGASTAGVQGISKASGGNGVWGVANKGGSAYGVYGQSSAGIGTVGSGGHTGAQGITSNDYGIGVEGISSGAAPAPGVSGYSTYGPGVQGFSGTSGSFGTLADGPYGVYGYTYDSVAVYAFSEDAVTGWAGYFDGDVYVGDLYSSSTFTQVDHPAAPGERWYRTALVGSFEQLDVISGNARTGADGRVTVRVPETFASYHADFRYQLTPVGAAAVPFVAKRMHDGRFVIGADRPRLLVSWQVTARRTDPVARAADFRVEVRKAPSEQGRFLHPKLYGKSVRRSLMKRPASDRRAASRHPAVKDVSSD